MEDKDSYRSSTSYIRLCIFLITSVYLGLPVLVWAFCLLYLHVKIRKKISCFILLLLLSDLIQLFLSVYILTQVLMILNWTPEFFQLWSGLHWCGFHLHQLVTLEGVLTLKYPLFSHPCYYIILILVLVFSVLSSLMFFKDTFVNMNILLIGTSLSSLCLLVVTFTVTHKTSSSPVSKNTHSVFAVAFFTFVMLFLPFFMLLCVNVLIGEVHTSWYMMCLCLISLRVISDPILCVLICRENLRAVQTPQTHTEPDSDETPVARGSF